MNERLKAPSLLWLIMCSSYLFQSVPSTTTNAFNSIIPTTPSSSSSSSSFFHQHQWNYLQDTTAINNSMANNDGQQKIRNKEQKKSSMTGTVAILLPSFSDYNYNPVLEKSANEIGKLLQQHHDANRKKEQTSVANVFIKTFILTCCDNNSNEIEIESTATITQKANVLIALGIESPLDVKFVATIFRQRRAYMINHDGDDDDDDAADGDDNNDDGSIGTNVRAMCQFALGGKPFASLVDCYDEANPPSVLENLLPWTSVYHDHKLCQTMQSLFDSEQIEEYVKAIQLFFAKKQKKVFLKKNT